MFLVFHPRTLRPGPEEPPQVQCPPFTETLQGRGTLSSQIRGPVRRPPVHETWGLGAGIGDPGRGTTGVRGSAAGVEPPAHESKPHWKTYVVAPSDSSEPRPATPGTDTIAQTRRLRDPFRLTVRRDGTPAVPLNETVE